MTQNEISDAFADKVTHIGDVTISKEGFLNKLFKRKQKMPLSVGIIPSGKVQKIGVLLKSMTDFKSIEYLGQADQINTLLSENIVPIAEIISLGVVGAREDINPIITSSILNQWGNQQLHDAFIEVYRRLDLEPFFGILSLSKNLALNLFQDKEPHGQA